MKLSIIVPALNEAAVIAAALGALSPLRARGHEVIVADGGSEDATRELAAPLADKVTVPFADKMSPNLWRTLIAAQGLRNEPSITALRGNAR